MGGYFSSPSSGPPGDGKSPPVKDGKKGQMWLAREGKAASELNPLTQNPNYVYETPNADQFVEYESGQHWNVAVDAEIKIRQSKAGRAAAVPVTVFQNFDKAVQRNGEKLALVWERDGKEIKWTYKAYYDDITKVALAYIRLGMPMFGCANIIGFNSPQWFIADLAAIMVGGKAAGIYTTNGPEACQYITEHSEATIVVCENAVQLDKFMKVRDKLPLVKAYIVWDGEFPASVNEGKFESKAYSWDQVLKMGEEATDADKAELKKRLDDTRPGHCCTLIYTSGTTGPPKAVMISHDNCTWTASLVTDFAPPAVYVPEAHTISYLPLSHIAAQMLDLHLPVHVTANCKESHGCTIHFARPDALKGSLSKTLATVRPTMLMGVPRVWEKIEESMRAKGAQATGMAKKIGGWAKESGAVYFASTQVGSAKQDKSTFYNSLAYKKVRQALGLDRCAMCISAAAPISQDTLNYFGSLDIPIQEVYGMSECTGPQTSGLINYFRVGTVGVSLPGCELWVDHKADRGDKAGEGELCYRGRHIMMGYMKDVKKTQEAIDEKGWLHSGDLGAIDERGLVRITGRIKELIIGAGGENIAPVPFEYEVKRNLPAIANCMMVGDKRKYNTILLCPKVALDKDTGAPSSKLVAEAAAVGSATTLEEVSTDPKWLEYIEKGLKAANKNAVSNAAHVQYFRFIPDFSVPGGELTSTLKLKRQDVCKKHAELIESMYDEKTAKLVASTAAEKKEGAEKKEQKAEAKTEAVATPTTPTTTNTTETSASSSEKPHTESISSPGVTRVTSGTHIKVVDAEQ